MAYDQSILKVVTNLKPVQSKYYKLSAGEFYKEINGIFQQIENNEFIKFYSQEEAKLTKLENPDQYITINFEDFVVGETHIKERVEKMELDSVNVGQVTLADGSKQNVFGTVTADVKINRIEVISRGIINLNLSEANVKQRAIIDQSFAGNYVWFNEWGNFNGDERALTDAQFAICSRARINPIPAQQMFIEFTKPIHSQLKNKLVIFYKGY